MIEQLEKYAQAKALFKGLIKEARELLIYELLRDKDIDFTTISLQYVKALESWDKDNKIKLTEAGICISQHLFELQYTDKGRKKRNFDYSSLDEQNKKAIQRSLYFLNKEGRMQMDSLNELLHYDEAEASKLSWYERNKNCN